MINTVIRLATAIAAALHFSFVSRLLPAVVGSLPAQLFLFTVPPIVVILTWLATPRLPPILAIVPCLAFPVVSRATFPIPDLILLFIILSASAHAAAVETAFTFFTIYYVFPYITIPPYLLRLLPSHRYLPVLLVALFTTLLASRSHTLASLRPIRKPKRRRKPLQLPSWTYLPLIFIVSLAFASLVTPPLANALCKIAPRPLPQSYSILEQHRGPTGLISVVERFEGHRMLTADLSVLGGYHVKPGFFPDSIFEQFHVHEAIRLTRLPADSDALQGGRNGRALCIGVGVGVVAQSLHQLGCKLDAVELDPVIPKFAQKWFRLTAPVTVADALVFVADSKPKVYDYVIHDVFTGGAVATKLFSVETFESVRRSMKEDGVLAVNFVGSTDEPPNSPGTRAVSVVYQRLKHSFAHVRAFSDGIDTRTHNIVFFASQVKERVTFRKPTDSDALGSRLRIRALQSFEKHEVDQNVLNAVNGTNNSEWIFNVGLWDIAIEHRQAMMKVHPKDLWPALLAAEYPQ